MRSMSRQVRLASVALLSAAFCGVEPVAAEILFKADFETGDFSQFGGTEQGRQAGAHQG